MGDSSDIMGHEAEDNAPSAAELEAAGQESMFGGAPEVTPAPIAKPAAAQPYRVLARKYRSQTFAELIGQEFSEDRLLHLLILRLHLLIK